MILQHRDFRILWIGQFISKLGSQFNYIALAWLVLKTTESATAAGGVYLAQVLPAALLGWVAGVPVDRTSKRSMMFHCDWLRALLVIILPISFAVHHINSWLIYAVTFAVSALSLLFYAAEKTLILKLVPEEQLTEANAFAEMTEQIGALAGPVVAGIIIAVLPSPVYILYFDAASFLFSAVTVLMLHYREEISICSAGAAQLLNEAKEGLICLLHNPLLKVIFFTAASINFLACPFTVVFPVFSERVLLSGSQGFGWLMGAFGGGMLAGTLAVPWFSQRLSPRATIYGGMTLMGLGFIAMSFCHTLWPAVILAAITSLGVGPGNAIIVTLVQKHTPEAMLGRIFANMSGLLQAAVPLGVAIAAPLLDWSSAPVVLVGMGLGTLICTAVGYMWLSRVLPQAAATP